MDKKTYSDPYKEKRYQAYKQRYMRHKEEEETYKEKYFKEIKKNTKKKKGNPFIKFLFWSFIFVVALIFFGWLAIIIPIVFLIILGASSDDDLGDFCDE